MKKSLLKIMAVFMAVIFLQLQVFAGSSFSMSSDDETIVNFDETEIYASFDQINDLTSYISGNDVTYTDVQNYNSSMVENVSSSAALAMNSTNAGDPPIVSAFLWGCILNWVGIVIVGITTEWDMSQIWKAVWGCLAETVVIAVIEIIYYVVAYGSLGYY
jgi:hypothetical protein